MAIIDVIKYDRTPDVFAWKHPKAELGTWTQLIVNQSQEAILFKDGKALDLFGAGRHTLSTANIPLLNNIVNLPFGGRSPFAAEVWYVSKAHALDVKWGTSSPIKLQDPKYNIIVPVRAFGQMGIRIEDSRKFLVKLVGTLSVFNKESLINYFRGLIMMNFNSILTGFLVHQKISVLEINAYLGEMSKHFETSIAPGLEEFGIRVVNLFINAVNLPEDDPSVQRLRDALARKAEMDIIGFTYQQERTFDTLEGAATNEGGGQAPIMGAGLGLGMGVGMGGAFGTQMSDLTRGMDTSGKPRSKVCASCQHVNLADAAFCSGCGTRLAESPNRDSSAQAPAIHCNVCGKPLQKGSKFCTHCGDKYNACPKCGSDNMEGSAACKVCNEPLDLPCPHCTKPVPGGSKFCKHCGGSLVLECSNCKHEVKPGQKFCLECGFNLQQGGKPS